MTAEFAPPTPSRLYGRPRHVRNHLHPGANTDVVAAFTSAAPRSTARIRGLSDRNQHAHRRDRQPCAIGPSEIARKIQPPSDNSVTGFGLRKPASQT
jgi:hypothetical protein